MSFNNEDRESEVFCLPVRVRHFEALWYISDLWNSHWKASLVLMSIVFDAQLLLLLGGFGSSVKSFLILSLLPFPGRNESWLNFLRLNFYS